MINIIYSNLENMHKSPQEPITIHGLGEFMLELPTEVIVDLVRSICTDTEVVAVPLHLLKTIVDVAKNTDMNDRTMGGMDALESMIEDHYHFAEKLEDARKKETHY